jgi:hypothetical protein
MKLKGQDYRQELVELENQKLLAEEINEDMQRKLQEKEAERVNKCILSMYT